MKIKQLDDLVWTDYSLIDNIEVKQIEKEINKTYDYIEEMMIRVEKLKVILDEETIKSNTENLKIETDINYELKEVTLPKDYKYMAKTILAFTVHGIFIGEFRTGIDVSKSLDVDDGVVYKCCIGKRKNHNGYTFRYNFI